MKKPIYVIAEAGVNHNGSASLAKDLVKAAKRAGADCVKFQTFKAEQVLTRNAPKAKYQLQSTSKSETQFEMLRSLELSLGALREIQECCRREGIDFLSTPYGPEDIDALQGLGVVAFKVASGQIVEPHFLRAVARTGKRIYLSTGMATLAEVDLAVRTIREAGNDDLVLLQCTTNYPSRPADANLRAIATMAAAFRLPMGYSDHTTSETACLVAVGMGAIVIEKHLTLDKKMAGPDHSCSAEPSELAHLVASLREAQMTLGSGDKVPCDAEKENALAMRRSLVAARKISAGERFTPESITAKRPSTGISPIFFDLWIGCVANRDISPDELLTWSMCGERT